MCTEYIVEYKEHSVYCTQCTIQGAKCVLYAVYSTRSIVCTVHSVKFKELSVYCSQCVYSTVQSAE